MGVGFNLVLPAQGTQLALNVCMLECLPAPGRAPLRGWDRVDFGAEKDLGTWGHSLNEAGEGQICPQDALMVGESEGVPIY